MSNIILFKSSLVLSLIHYIVYLYYKPNNIILLYIFIIGLGASILNHLMTNELIKFIDRIVMLLAAIIESIIIIKLDLTNQLICFSFLKGAIILYIFAKLYKKTIIHALAHILLTMNHIILMRYYSTSVYLE